MNLTLTDNAYNYIKKLAVEKFGANIVPYLRLSVQAGGCSSLSYKLDWETNLQANNHCFVFEGFEIVVDKRSALFLDGVVVDYSDGLDGKGFEFNNPISSRTCGCGQSFSV